MQALAEALGTPNMDREKDLMFVEPDYEKVKNWIVFLPEEFLNTVRSVWDKGKQLAIIWDDAGYWLFSLDWYKPLVKIVAKILNLIGTRFACVVLTSPDVSQISNKVIEAMPDLYECFIQETGRDTRTRRIRLAKTYQRWRSRDRKKRGVRTRWEDKYDAMLPNDFYNWYNPKREHYLDIALKELELAVRWERQKRMKVLRKKDEEEMQERSVVYGAVSEEKLQELEELIIQVKSEM